MFTADGAREKKMRISIFGFGEFGQLITKYLVKYADIYVYDRNQAKTELIKSLGGNPVNLEDAASCEVIIVATTLDALESTLLDISPLVKPGTLVADVTSVKIKPAEMMMRILPKNVQILATHPLFGNVSATGPTLEGHKIVVDPLRVENMDEIEKFLHKLGLDVIHLSCDEHDKEMAWVHALTFFVGRGVMALDPPHSHFRTGYYNKLMAVVDMERTHSLELFYTIQRGNPYAKEMRQRLVKSFEELEADIEKEL